MAGMTAVTCRACTLALIRFPPSTILSIFVGAGAGSSMDSGGSHVKNNARIASIGTNMELMLHIHNSSLIHHLVVVAGVILGVLGIIAALHCAKKELNNIIAGQEVEHQDQGGLGVGKFQQIVR
jgi:hypothetical protein